MTGSRDITQKLLRIVVRVPGCCLVRSGKRVAAMAAFPVGEANFTDPGTSQWPLK
ncbi:hypothetical protein CRPA1_53000 [Pseudomonas aeruginosa]|nr:hypothetical protein HMPREF3150_04857 [Pseudomonas aeruginosa]